ncbi:tyrosine/serine protein phosphatase-like protein [Morchella conica CCBAS932]|uniref:Tyrosine/serine protein phosphatase-like protein n=1 Tax=Morchella conica CCBAS932 TaxID=1392247 RepID=A0A3N4KY66_9PEZI|nr:tyrosine/serine protein phosphatase-like protein [Morchella conica CCBAS932]
MSVPFQALHNFRDVGTSINSHDRKRIMKSHMLYRSARPDDATAVDRERLMNEYGIRTVIDLRTNSEHIKQARQRATPVVPLEGARTVRINFIGRRFEVALLKRLGWWDLVCFLVLFILRFRLTAISLLGRKVLRPRGLPGLCHDSLLHCQSEIRETLTILSDPSSYPVLMHCTQGKDRTGLIAMLVLLLLDASVPAVQREYEESWEGLEGVRESMVREMLEVGLGSEFAGTPEGLVGEVEALLKEGWGGVEGYLESVGVDVVGLRGVLAG